ncbi:hypothetical protein L1F30_01000 [Simiduia sp. 21SJ11W-1]|uniref:hypothetical protein n=1 Tax=Simiduia sp. 21SJ11W-1 TaxID=2909669 RepID=UPI00209F8843|nr:hypothetical protein [Simiduia sp. 21SJ11W-1]UTA48133.1 hypothetical protein L1F30_01000 [Simiduia sp. 21SJ11W-1]
MRLFLFSIALSLLTGCAAEVSLSSQQKEINDFAQANCLFWYFKDQGLPLEDIRAIAGGMVETSNLPAEVFQEIAQAVQSFTPVTGSKANIDPNLSRCFQLHENAALQAIVNRYP